MKRTKIQLSLRHLKIVVMLIIVVFSNDIMCQKRHLRRPTNPKSLGFSKSLQSVLPYNSNNNRSGGGSKTWPFKFVNKSSKQPKLKKPFSSNHSLTKKKGLLKPKNSRKNVRGPNYRFTRPRPSLGLKGLGGLISKKPQRIIKKLGPSSSAFGRSKKYRPSNRGNGQNRSGSSRSQLYSNLPNSDIDNGIRRQSGEASNRVRRKLDVINEWISRIKDSTKHHSMSPSYTSKSRIQTIPVSSLPLQNEPVAIDNFHLSKGKKIINQIFQPQSAKPQQKKRLNGPKGRKGQKKQSIWPTKLSLGFLGNTPKGKRGFSSKKPNFSSKRPSPFSGSSSIKPPRGGEIINKVKSKRLSPQDSSSFSKDHFPKLPQTLQNHEFPTTLNSPIDTVRNSHAISSSGSKGAFVVDPTFSPFNIQTAAAGSSAGGFFPKPYEHSTRGSPNRFPVTVNPLKRKNFGSGENKFGLNFSPNNKSPIQFTPTEGYQGLQSTKENFFGRGDDSKLMGNPLSRYRPMPMEEPVTDIGKFNIPTSTSKFFDKRKDTRKPEYPTRNKDIQSNRFPSFSNLDSVENEVMEFNTKTSKYANQRPSNQRKKNLRKKVDRTPYPKSTTPRPIPIPGKDFDFVVRPKVPLTPPPQPQQPALPVSNPLSNYDRNYNEYEDNYDYNDEYDNNDEASNFDGDEKFNANVGFMDSGFGPAWEPNKLSRRKRDAPEGRSAASSIFWHNGQPIRPRNRKNRRRNRQNVWGERNHSEEEEILDYHGIRGNRDGGYHHGSGGRGQTEAADFWEDFNVHDPQSIYADKFTAQEEYGNGAGNYHQNTYNSPTPSVESSWGQRQPISRNQGGRKNRYHRDPYPQQSIQDRYQGKERYGNEFYGDPIYIEEKNEVLGSGNFDVIQGGTFYDGDAYYDEYDYRRPQPTRYDSENNIENNFRDFADIKNDLLKYDQGYVPRYK